MYIYPYSFLSENSLNIVILHLTMGIYSEKCIVRQYHCASFIECTYTNLDGTSYHIPKLNDTFCYSLATNLYSTLLYKIK